MVDQMNQGSIVYKKNPTARDELKHSVHLHMLIMGGPTQQLAVLLTSIVDLLPGDPDQNFDEVDNQIKSLAYTIIESIALFVQRSIDERNVKAQNQGGSLPEDVVKKGNNIWVMLGNSRGLPDKVSAKNSVLKVVAEALHALSATTGSKYPTINNACGDTL